MQSENKPKLVLLNPRTMTFESLLSFCEALTGKETTDEEKQQLQERWAKISQRISELASKNPRP